MAGDGLRKRCGCSKRRWAKCGHPWWMGFSWQRHEYRFSLHKVLDKPASYSMSKSEAESWRDRFKAEIREGTFRDPTKPEPEQPPADPRFTFGDISTRYLEEHIRRPGRRQTSRTTMEWHLGVLRRLQVPVSGGYTQPLESLPMELITKAHIEAARKVCQRRKPRSKGGLVGANRLLARLRHIFSWAIEQGYVEQSPFRRGFVTMVKLDRSAESPRTRRLHPGEEQLLLQHASRHLRDLIATALDTGCRKGELLNLRWQDVSLDRNCLLVRSETAKTGEARAIPLTGRVRTLLEARRQDPAGDPLGPDTYVFGNEVGERRRSIRTAFENCRNRAGITDLHFHDLRRECGSRLLESGASPADVRDWLGHSNLLTTNRYLATSGTRLQLVLRQFESRWRQAEPDTESDSEPTSDSSQVEQFPSAS